MSKMSKVFAMLMFFACLNLFAKDPLRTIKGELIKSNNSEKLTVSLMEIKQTPVDGGIQFRSFIYQIVLDQNGKKLIPLIGKEVKVTGLVRKIKQTTYIKVKKFELVK